MKRAIEKNRVIGDFYQPCVKKSSLYLIYCFSWGLVIVVSVLITDFVYM